MKKNAKKFGLVIGIILFIGIIGFGYFVGMTVFEVLLQSFKSTIK